MVGNFNHDLAIGKTIENEVCRYIQRKYKSAQVIDGYCKGGDIIVPEVNLLIEVKYDIMSHKTGNFCIEIEYAGEPSALATTESDWWVIVDYDWMIWLTPDTIWMIMKQHGLRPVHLTGSGDSKEKVAYLVKKELFLYSPYAVKHQRKSYY